MQATLLGNPPTVKNTVEDPAAEARLSGNTTPPKAQPIKGRKAFVAMA
jgi:hypothetical protein